MAGKSIGAATVSVKVKLQDGAGAEVKKAIVSDVEGAGVGTALSNSIGGQFKASFRSVLTGGGGIGSTVKSALSNTAGEVADTAGASGALAGATMGAALGLALEIKVGEALVDLGLEIQGAFDSVSKMTGETGSALDILDKR